MQSAYNEARSGAKMDELPGQASDAVSRGAGYVTVLIGAVFGYPFELGHLSGWDYFHPNTTGQNILAEETWAVGFEWASAKNGGGNGGGNGNGNGNGNGGGKK